MIPPALLAHAVKLEVVVFFFMKFLQIRKNFNNIHFRNFTLFIFNFCSQIFSTWRGSTCPACLKATALPTAYFAALVRIYQPG